MKRLPFFLAAFLVCAFAFNAPLHGQETVVVTNAASFESVPLSPGCWATAFADFASVSVVDTPPPSTLPFPTTLGGVQVFVDNVAAPMNFVGTTQINFLVPKDTPATGQIALRIAVAGNTTYEGTVNLWPVSPGLIALTGEPTRPGAVLNQDSTLNTEQNPAARGEIVQIFGVGGDFAELPSDDGAAAPQDQLISTTTTPRAYVSTVEAQVQFSGLAPGLVNAWQINVFVPEESFISGQVPVIVDMDGFKSNLVSIWVAE